MKAFYKRLKNHPKRDLFLFTLYTGLRQGELIGLIWRAIDLANQTMNAEGNEVDIPPEENAEPVTKPVMPAPDDKSPELRAVLNEFAEQNGLGNLSIWSVICSARSRSTKEAFHQMPTRQR